jgi:hypothetical protein
MQKIKKALLLSVMVMALAMTANAQDNVIKTNPIGLAFGNFNVTYERVLNDKSSVLGSANFRFGLFGIDVFNFGLGAGYRYYFTHANKDVPTGFYVNPQAGFGFGSVTEEDVVDNSFTTFGIGAELGYQWAWTSGFVLDLGIGPNYTVISGDVDDVGFDSTSGILPSVTIAIGFAF